MLISSTHLKLESVLEVIINVVLEDVKTIVKAKMTDENRKQHGVLTNVGHYPRLDEILRAHLHGYLSFHCAKNNKTEIFCNKKIEKVTVRIRRARLRWYGHIEIRGGDHVGLRTLHMALPGNRKRGRPRRRCPERQHQRGYGEHRGGARRYARPQEVEEINNPSDPAMICGISL